jgi:hypothetical protein
VAILLQNEQILAEKDGEHKMEELLNIKSDHIVLQRDCAPLHDGGAHEHPRAVLSVVR